MTNEINRKISELEARAQELIEVIKQKKPNYVSIPPLLVGGVPSPLLTTIGKVFSFFSKKKEKQDHSKYEETLPEEKLLEEINKQLSELYSQKKVIIEQQIKDEKDPERLITIDYLKEFVKILEVEYIVITYCDKNQVAFVASDSSSNALYSRVGVDSEVYSGLTVKG